MKKYVLFFIAVLMLAGCGKKEATPMFTEQQAIPFEIVHYEEKVAPVFQSLVPHIAYAKTEGQFQELKGRFNVEGLDMDMEKYMAVFLVTYSGSCGIAVDGAYDYNNYLAVQLLESTGEACESEGVPHTFVLQVEKKDYKKVQLFNGDIIKSSADID